MTVSETLRDIADTAHFEKHPGWNFLGEAFDVKDKVQGRSTTCEIFQYSVLYILYSLGKLLIYIL